MKGYSSSSSSMNNWNSRRSTVVGRSGMVATSQPLATAVGIKILQSGGTAADAAVAIAAALNVVEPVSTGIGGDAFCLYYDATTKSVSSLQGNGASAGKFTLDLLHQRAIGQQVTTVNGSGSNAYKPLSRYSGLCVTVPGAAALWEDLIRIHGKLTLTEVLAPAISLAEQGFPISPLVVKEWNESVLQGEEAHKVLRPNGPVLSPGDIHTNPDLANTFRTIARQGVKAGFYDGVIAQAIVDAVAEFEGVLSIQDLRDHVTRYEPPISVVYRGIRIYQTPPPSHGVAVLIALKVIEKLTSTNDGTSLSWKKSRGSVVDTHISIESMRIAFAETLHHVSDPQYMEIPVEALLSDEHITKLANRIKLDRSISLDSDDYSCFATGETVYFCCVDAAGNACSIINSNYLGFGTGIMPKGVGFVLHNRGHNFSLIPGHVNQAGPRKFPYHTIIPALGTYVSDQTLFAAFGCMGGFMQPQGQVQIVRNLIDYRLDPQQAIDAPRWYICNAGKNQAASDMALSEVLLEDGYEFSEEVDDMNKNTTSSVGSTSMGDALKQLQHSVVEKVVGDKRVVFGRAQVILLQHNAVSDGSSGNYKNGDVFFGGSDPRCDGCAMPVI